MMRANEALPDLEKLGHHEFDLDIDEQVRLQNEGEALLQKVTVLSTVEAHIMWVRSPWEHYSLYAWCMP